MPASVLVKSTITLSVAGVSRCVGFEAYAAISIVPAVTGVGVAVAFEVPVEVEACGVSVIPGEVEVRAWGSGLSYSTVWLRDKLLELAAALYEDEYESPLRVLERVGELGVEAAAASVHGSAAVTLHPLEIVELPLQGYAVAVKLDDPVENALAAVLEEVQPGELLKPVLYSDEDELAYVLNELTLRRMPLPQELERTLVKSLSEGAKAVALSCCGTLALALADDVEQASRIAKVFSPLGDYVYAPLV